MAKITLRRDKCKGCLLCISVCPKGSLRVDTAFNKLGVRPIKFKKGAVCIGCAQCAIMCPDCCIEVYR